MMLKISDFIFVLLSLLLLPNIARATNPVEPFGTDETTFAMQLPPDTTKKSAAGFQGVTYLKTAKNNAKIPLFSGYGIYADLAGAAMTQFSSFGQYEVGAHFGLKRKFFPAVELGLGQSDHRDERYGFHYKVHSPYLRVGIDYNLNKNRHSHNRYFVGVRYGFSSFIYDLDGVTITDNYWTGQKYEINEKGVKSNAQWGELLFGIQSQLWKFVHLGWTIRYKARFQESEGQAGRAYYIPGYGKNGSGGNCFGGSFNLIFEL